MKDFLITLAWIVGTIIVCFFGFRFVMRGAMELALEYKAFSSATVSNSNGISTTSSNDGSESGEQVSLYENEVNNSRQTSSNEWLHYVSSEHHFSVNLPRRPLVKTVTNSQATLHSYSASNITEEFQVDYIAANSSYRSASAEELEHFVEGLAQSQYQRIENMSFDANEQVVQFVLVDEVTQRYSRGVVIPKDDFNLFVLQYKCESSMCSENTYEDFVASFKIVE